MKKIYIYRNQVIEYLLNSQRINYELSGYEDISNYNENIEELMFFYILPYKFNTQKLVEEINDYYNRLKYIVDNNKEKIIYVLTLYNYFEFNLISNSNILNNTINEFNNKIYDLGKNLKVIRIEKFLDKFKKNDIMDMKYYYSYNLILNPKFKKEFSDFLEKEILKYSKYRKKCLLLDLDNTIWGKIVGEDGVNNLEISGNYPGNCFSDFQKLILEVKKTGVILCAVSKNNLEDVMEAFEKREDMILKQEDFVLIKASWRRKDEVIKEISKTLNITLGDMVFIDDNELERELVRYSLPDINVLDFPSEPYLLTKYYSQKFEELFFIDNLNEETLNKTKQYEIKIKGDELKNIFSSIDDFIKQLNMKISFEKLRESNLLRIVELINKSNQFNLTTKRYTVLEIEKEKENKIVYAMKVEDKFGDLGIVGVSIVDISNKDPEIDTFLISCRVIGRKVENIFLQHIIREIKEMGYTKLKSKYIKTPKNLISENFYSDNNFEIIKKTDRKIEYEIKL